MPRKPTLSPSKIATYLACPAKYKWTYVDDRGRWYLRSKSYYSFGTTLHRVLQRFHDSSDAGVQTVHQAVAAVEESWVDAGYASAQEMQEALGEGKALIEAYVSRQVLEPSEATTILIEKQFRKDLGQFALIGRVDRVDEYPDGTLEIIDYKSGRASVETEDVQGDLAMSCYQLLLREKFPGRPVCASILAIRSNQKATYAMSDDEAEEFERDLVFLGQEILDRDYEGLVPTYKPDLCPECDFVALCRQHPDYSEPT